MARVEDRTYTAKEWEEMSAIAQTETGDFRYIKANIPGTLGAYEGRECEMEGVWVIIDSGTHRSYKSDTSEGTFLALLANDSILQPRLNALAFDYKNETAKPFRFEYRGAERPILSREHLMD